MTCETSPLRWLGIDVSKATFHAARSGPAPRSPTADALSGRGSKADCRSFPRNPEGVKAFLAWAGNSATVDGLAVVMEATGGYSKPLAKWLLCEKPNLRVAIANPFQVKHFALGLGLRNKTDAQDARMLAAFGEIHHPRPYQPMPIAYEELQALCRERSAQVKALTAARNRDEVHSDSRVAQRVRLRLERQHEKAITDLDKAIDAHIRAHPDLKRDFDLLCTVPGVGPVVASGLMGELGDLRDFAHPRALTSFVGLTPVLKDSGSSVHGKPHMSKHGSSEVRRLLYMTALTLSHGDHTLGDVYKRLVSEGKEPMVALGAVMRKSLVVLRAILVSGKGFEPHHIKTKPWEEPI